VIFLKTDVAILFWCKAHLLKMHLTLKFKSFYKKERMKLNLNNRKITIHMPEFFTKPKLNLEEFSPEITGFLAMHVDLYIYIYILKSNRERDTSDQNTKTGWVPLHHTQNENQ
jgi:hypothetical protein